MADLFLESLLILCFVLSEQLLFLMHSLSIFNRLVIFLDDLLLALDQLHLAIKGLLDDIFQIFSLSHQSIYRKWVQRYLLIHFLKANSLPKCFTLVFLNYLSLYSRILVICGELINVAVDNLVSFFFVALYLFAFGYGNAFFGVLACLERLINRSPLWRIVLFFDLEYCLNHANSGVRGYRTRIRWSAWVSIEFIDANVIVWKIDHTGAKRRTVSIFPLCSFRFIS